MATKKTTKGVAPGRPKKAATSGKKVTSKRASAEKPAPTDDQIRKKAEEIYYERIARGEHGTPEDDWHKAEELLKGTKK